MRQAWGALRAAIGAWGGLRSERMDLTEAVDISDDGRVILGNGADANGPQQARIYRAGAIITPNGVAESFASLAAVPLVEANAIDATLNTQFELASQQCAPRADGQPSRYCIYARRSRRI